MKPTYFDIAVRDARQVWAPLDALLDPDDERAIREHNEAVYLEAVRRWFARTDTPKDAE